jgi:hypothetical protein
MKKRIICVQQEVAAQLREYQHLVLPSSPRTSSAGIRSNEEEIPAPTMADVTIGATAVHTTSAISHSQTGSSSGRDSMDGAGNGEQEEGRGLEESPSGCGETQQGHTPLFLRHREKGIDVLPSAAESGLLGYSALQISHSC